MEQKRTAPHAGETDSLAVQVSGFVAFRTAPAGIRTARMLDLWTARTAPRTAP